MASDPSGSEPAKVQLVPYATSWYSELIEFAKKHQADIYKKAITIKGMNRKVVNEGKKSEIIFFEPVFALHHVGESVGDGAVHAGPCGDLAGA